jgi:hypothetical protein
LATDRTEYLREYNKKAWAENKEQDSKRHGEWRLANKERRNAYARKWHAQRVASDEKTYRNETRRSRLKRKYGITPEDYERMLLFQGSHCALCDRTEEDERHKRLNVDHCHETGKIRGLLCTPHNHALGWLGDGEAGLLRALAYIKRGQKFSSD